MSGLNSHSRGRALALAVCAALVLAPALGCAEPVAATFPDLQLIAKPKTPTKPVLTITKPKPTPNPITVNLTVGFVVMLYLNGDIGTILLGNPAIANATLTDGRMIVLRGVGPGASNMIVLDTAGVKLAGFVLQVSNRKPGMVTVRRAMVVESYACFVGICESTSPTGPTPMIGAAAPPGPS